LQPAHGYAKSKTMPTDQQQPNRCLGKIEANRSPEKPPLTPAAQRALAEAAVRRAERDRHPPHGPKELSGRGGPEPTRYGDWEVNGLTSDF
jgi:hypothetical protein